MHTSFDNQVKETTFIEKRTRREDRRFRGERRGGINPSYTGEARRLIIDRRTGRIDRRKPA